MCKGKATMLPNFVPLFFSHKSEAYNKIKLD